jgi:fucose 4-O-acetylase-like acetyltransferase
MLAGSSGAASMHQGVSNLRFWAIASVVAVHAFPTEALAIADWPLVALALVKFGTIGFFVASGYLLQDRRYPGYDAFFRARWRTVALPWLLWLAVHLALLQWLRAREGQAASWPELPQLAYDALFHSSFWFVPNFFAAAWLYGRIAARLSEGATTALLLLPALVHAANVHAMWFTTYHSLAVLGFVFHLHVGVLLRRHEARWLPWLRRWRALVAALALAAMAAAVAESRQLMAAGSHDVINTLRLSNQVYSLALATLLLGTARSLVPPSIPERRSTFAIYLMHTAALMLLTTWLEPWRPRIGGGLAPHEAGPTVPVGEGAFLLWWLGLGAAAWLLSLGAAALLRAAGLGAVIGGR